MNIVPTTTCRRCHRQYPSFRSRCPYCGTKKTKTVRAPAPETDSTVQGSPAAKSAAETVNTQLIIGSVLLLAVIILTIFMVSSSVGRDAAEVETLEQEQQEQQENQVTPVPPPTATPSPSPSPQPQVTNVSITSNVYPGFEYNGVGFFGSVGQSITFEVSWFPREVQSIPEWTSSDESVATVDQNGTITLVGSGQATVTVKISDGPNGSGSMPITVK